jgi:hypothetical protein
MTKDLEERLIKKVVLDTEPGEERLAAFAKIAAEHGDDVEEKISFHLCFVLTRNRLAGELVALRHDRDALKERSNEIADYYGQLMRRSVEHAFRIIRPPICEICGGEEDREHDPLELYQASSDGCVSMHVSCREKFHAECDAKKPKVR